MGNWKYDSIKEKETKRVMDRFGEASREELLERLIELETAMYPFEYVLTSITNADDPSGRFGVHATSKLFAIEPNDGPRRFMKRSEIGGSVDLDIQDKDLHLHDYYEEESITIHDGAALDDSVDILSVHDCGPGCYISCGAITVGDIRRLEKVRNDPYKKVSETET